MSYDPVLLYDGVCGFCNGTVQFVLAHDRRHRVQFAALQGDFARQVFDRHTELAGVDSLVLVERDVSGEQVYVKSTAALRLAGHIGGVWRLAQVFYVVPRFLRDAAYDVFARYRYRLFGRYDTCPLPTPAQRARFID